MTKSNYSISQTKAIQRCQFVEEEITYEVIDTIGLNDTKLNREDILYKLVELAHELKDGLHQILLVTNGRFTEEEIQVYQILETVLFDENVKNYTTIQIGVYRPSNLEKLNERIMDYMKYENRELVIQEMDKHVLKFEDKLSNLGQIGSFISGLVAVATIIIPLKFNS
uniref:AIG1-type G domain-containing protein n=1 Tax=Rhizophagus irregularis (strain DAOM 181602 / DAOM 197198 / MUCL 43194) TaxID=747089 RepID=U9T159_RHIID